MTSICVEARVAAPPVRLNKQDKVGNCCALLHQITNPLLYYKHRYYDKEQFCFPHFSGAEEFQSFQTEALNTQKLIVGWNNFWQLFSKSMPHIPYLKTKKLCARTRSPDTVFHRDKPFFPRCSQSLPHNKSMKWSSYTCRSLNDRYVVSKKWTCDYLI